MNYFAGSPLFARPSSSSTWRLPEMARKISLATGGQPCIGQDKKVRIFNLCAAGSVEAYILEILDRKINMFDFHPCNPRDLPRDMPQPFLFHILDIPR
jgi:hypothetical protein